MPAAYDSGMKLAVAKSGGEHTKRGRSSSPMLSVICSDFEMDEPVIPALVP